MMLLLCENAPSLYSSPSMGEGSEGVMIILCYARHGHGG